MNTYQVIDKQTGKIVLEYVGENGSRARRLRDKRDNAHGAYRYIVNVIYAK